MLHYIDNFVYSHLRENFWKKQLEITLTLLFSNEITLVIGD